MAVVQRVHPLPKGWDQARDVANALRGKANRTDPPPRGAICLWTAGSSDDGHIAVADGNGNSVNNWDSGIVKRVSLALQRTGYVGWVSPALLG